MIDFGLSPCPLCGQEAEVETLTQGPEHLAAVIKCTGCGLTLNWETDIKVGISRSGKRTTVKAGPDPIEAWNRRADGGYKSYYDQVAHLPSCNNCGKAQSCEYCPKPGEVARINCPLWRAKEEAAAHE